MDQHTITISGVQLKLDNITLNYSPYLSTLFSTTIHVDKDVEGNIIFDEFSLDDMMKYINYLRYGIVNDISDELMNYMGHEGDYFIQWVKDHRHIGDLSLTHDVRREQVRIDERFIGLNYVYDNDKYIFYSHTPQDIIDRLNILGIKHIYDVGDDIVYMKRYSTIRTTICYPYKNYMEISGVIGPEGVSLYPFYKKQCIPLYCSKCPTIIDLVLDEELRDHTIIHKYRKENNINQLL